MVPEALLPLFTSVREAGGRALVVGGTVRDALLGVVSKDLDLEVHGLAVEPLTRLLARFGAVNEVGRSFGVLKLRRGGFDLDVSVPRRDSRVGSGHRGILAQADPFLGIVEAARRRDLTINAIAWDPLEQVFEDPFDGRADLEAGLLRAVDPSTFGEDPLRALRVAQFAARFGFRVDPALLALCAEMPLHELPAERIRGEVEKLLLKGRPPSRGWVVAEAMGAWARVLPPWRACPPEVDAVASLPVTPPPRRLALLLAAACAAGTEEDAGTVLDRLWIHRVDGYRVREQVLFLVRSLRVDVASDEACLRLADEGDLELLAWLRGDTALRARAERLGVLREPLPRLLLGRDLGPLGVVPGPRMGELLAQVRAEQLAGRLVTRDEALDWLRVRVSAPEMP
jgi:tRNA nucleotidyltransferase (CCA-adding enzyme)